MKIFGQQNIDSVMDSQEKLTKLKEKPVRWYNKQRLNGLADEAI